MFLRRKSQQRIETKDSKDDNKQAEDTQKTSEEKTSQHKRPSLTRQAKHRQLIRRRSGHIGARGHVGAGSPSGDSNRLSVPDLGDRSGASSGTDTEEDDGILEYQQGDIDGVLDQARETDPEISSVEQRIKHISRELLSTEESYVRKLGILLQLKTDTAKTTNSDMAKKIFPNIEAIYSLHNDNLLPALRERIQNWDKDPRLGDIMCRLAPFLKLYTEYVKNFQTATQLAQTTREKSVSFNKIFPKQKVGHLGIDALMIEPIQRVPRYGLLLKDYLKRLDESSTDRTDVQRALDLVTEAAGHFEKMMKRDAQILELGQLQNSLVGGGNIFSLSREILKKMDVILINPATGLKESCQLYLFNDLLLIVREISAITGGSRRLRTKHIIDLSKIKVTPGTSQDLDPSLEISTRKRRVEIGFRKSEESSEVKELIRKQMTDTTKRKLIRRGTWSDIQAQQSTLGENPPQFVPPHTVSLCMVCGEQFTSPKKKKHCAACGMVVCGACSCHQVELRYAESTQRVCQKCFPLLNHQTPSHDGEK